MKKRIGELKGKPIVVTNNEEEIKKNEIKASINAEGKISLSERVDNGEIKPITSMGGGVEVIELDETVIDQLHTYVDKGVSYYSNFSNFRALIDFLDTFKNKANINQKDYFDKETQNTYTYEEEGWEYEITRILNINVTTTKSKELIAVFGSGADPS